VSGLCPDPLGSPREEKEERRIDGGREVAWTPKIYDRSPPLLGGMGRRVGSLTSSNSKKSRHLNKIQNW